MKEKDDKFFDDVAEKYNERLEEKQLGKEHSEEVPHQILNEMHEEKMAKIREQAS